MAEATKKAVAEVEELPRTIVRRVVKDKLSRCSEDGEITVNKDALLAFSESARIFIHYLSATANDICKESKRQIISADDILKALEETEFPEFIRPLKASLEEFRKKNAGKRAAVSKGKENGSNKKRMVERESSEKGNGAESSENGDGAESSEKLNGAESSEKGEADESSEKGDAGESSEEGDAGESSEEGDAGESSGEGKGSDSE